jgi:hypothetical protein
MTTSTATLAQVLDQGDLSTIGNAFKSGKVGTLIAGGGVRHVKETVAVSGDAATPSFAIRRLLSAKVVTGSTGTGEKAPVLNGGVALRTVRELALPVASHAFTPTFPVLALRKVKTTGTGAAGEKICDPNGTAEANSHAAANAGGTSVTVGANETGTGTAEAIYDTAGGVAVPNAGGTSVAFYAGEITGTATVELVYLTDAAPTDGTVLTSAVDGLY